MSPDLKQLLHDTAARPEASPDPADLIARGRRRRRRRQAGTGLSAVAIVAAATLVLTNPWAAPAPPEIVDQPPSATGTAVPGDEEQGEADATPDRTSEEAEPEEGRVALLEQQREQLQRQIQERTMALEELRAREAEIRSRQEEGEDVDEELAELAASRTELDAMIAGLTARRFALERELVELGALEDPVAAARAAATDEDRALTEGLVDLARDPSSESLDDVPFAETVGLGLADQLLREAPRALLVDPSSWVLDLEMFRAYTGPFSALDVLVDDGPTQTLVGEHPHCASPPVPPPPGFEEHRRVSLQPAATSSCLEWWTVDLFVDERGRIEAVTMDLYEP